MIVDPSRNLSVLPQATLQPCSIKLWIPTQYDVKFCRRVHLKDRSSRPELCSVTKVFLKISQNLLVPESLLATLWNKRLWHRCFPANCAKILRTPFFTEQLPWLHLWGAPKLYFTLYSCALIVLFNTGLYKSGIFTYLFFSKSRFSSFCVLGMV